MNNFCMTGNIAQDLNLKAAGEANQYVKFRMAVRRPFSKSSDFFTFCAWNKTAETLCQYCHKGSKIAVSGHVTTNDWETQDGQKRHDVEFIIDTVDFTAEKKEEPKAEPQTSALPELPEQLTMEQAAAVLDNMKAEGNTLPEINYSELPFEL